MDKTGVARYYFQGVIRMQQPETYAELLELVVKYQNRLRRQLLIDIFNNKNIHGSTLEEVAEYYGFEFVSRRFTFLVLNFVDRLTGSSMRKAQAMVRATELLEQSLLAQIPEGTVCPTDDLLLCLINLEDGAELSGYRSLLDESFALLRADERLNQFYCIMGVGIPCDDISMLRTCYDSAVGATQYGVLYGYDRWYPAVSAEASHLRSVPISPRRLSALQTALGSRSEEMLETWVRDTFSRAGQLFDEDPTYAYLLPRNIAQKAHALSAGSAGAEILAHAGDRLDSCISLEQEQQALIELFHQFCAADRREVNPAVILVQNYLQYHFHEPITLETLGRLTDLNPQYLSVMFKKETGCSVTEYIRQLRITTAQELLRSTSMSVGQIAETVGYEDPLYFSRIFQKKVHQSPRKYRNGTK